MAIDNSLLELLVCPENKTRLALADDKLIAALNKKIRGGTLINRGGGKVSEEFDGGLVRADRKFLYPIIEEIPVMLIEESIELKE